MSVPFALQPGISAIFGRMESAQDLALFYVSCVRSVIDYAAPVFFNGLPQYLKNELVQLKKRAISIITSGKCNSGIGNCRNVRGLGKSMVVVRLFEKLRYSN